MTKSVTLQNATGYKPARDVPDYVPHFKAYSVQIKLRERVQEIEQKKNANLLHF